MNWLGIDYKPFGQYFDENSYYSDHEQKRIFTGDPKLLSVNDALTSIVSKLNHDAQLRACETTCFHSAEYPRYGAVGVSAYLHGHAVYVTGAVEPLFKTAFMLLEQDGFTAANGDHYTSSHHGFISGSVKRTKVDRVEVDNDGNQMFIMRSRDQPELWHLDVDHDFFGHHVMVKFRNDSLLFNTFSNEKYAKISDRGILPPRPSRE